MGLVDLNPIEKGSSSERNADRMQRSSNFCGVSCRCACRGVCSLGSNNTAVCRSGFACLRVMRLCVVLY